MKSVVSAQHVPFFTFMTVRFAKVKMSELCYSLIIGVKVIAHICPSVYSLYIQKTHIYEHLRHADKLQSRQGTQKARTAVTDHLIFLVMGTRKPSRKLMAELVLK